jgi:hypothetical protein
MPFREGEKAWIHRQWIEKKNIPIDLNSVELV